MPEIAAIVPATNAPATLAGCLRAIEAADEPPEELVVVEEPVGASPASSRNRGVALTTADVLVFVDADVEVHPDAFSRIRARFDADSGLTALFGSYDDAPGQDGVVTAFRNLLHHHVHHENPGEASTFWAGLGAIRREAFLAAGGFSEHPIEDIELGMRLARSGNKIVLDPAVQGTHLKEWTVGSMVRTDLLVRGAPWVALLLRHGGDSATLNLSWRHRLSAASSVGLAAGILLRRPRLAGTSALALVVLNRGFYALLLRRGGARHATAGVGLHAVHHLTGVAAVPLGIARYWRERRLQGPE